MPSNKKDIEAAKAFCEAYKVEKELRDCIAEITAKLQRSNLSPVEGVCHAESLTKAYGLLEKLVCGAQTGGNTAQGSAPPS